jgi:hypothetical protein
MAGTPTVRDMKEKLTGMDRMDRIKAMQKEE